LTQNYGILCAFGGGFFLLLAIFTEFNTKLAGETPSLKFKRGTEALIMQAARKEVNDEEKDVRGAANGESETIDQAIASEEKAKEAMLDQPKMTNVFSWQHLSYKVRPSGEEMTLLDDVFGYVAPGKLTALMGESGAGKVGD
jgi:ATP-binding cassette subfamily G (WHITE) protein 2 (SNQ2)